MIKRPAIYNGQKLIDYGVDTKTGDIYSFRRGKPHKLKWSNRNSKNLDISYPCVTITDTKIFSDNYENSLTINVHQVVHETLSDRPLPVGMTDSEWRATPRSAKRLLRKGCADGWLVHHKDHKKTNFNPKNLTWSTQQDNMKEAKKYHSR